MSDGHDRKKQPNQRKKGVMAKLRNLVKIPPIFNRRRRTSAESAASAGSVPSVESTSVSSTSAAPSLASSVKPSVASPEGNTQSVSLQLPKPSTKKPVKKSSQERIVTAKEPRAADQSTTNKDADKNNRSPPVDDEKADKIERELLKLERSRKMTTKRLRKISDAYGDALKRAKNSSVNIDVMRVSENDKYAQMVAKLDDRRSSDARAELLDRMGKVMDECEQLENETADVLQRISSNIAKTPTEMLNEYALSFLKTVGLYDETDANHQPLSFGVKCSELYPFKYYSKR
ncbi:hypothetical protein AAVH_04448 [Aphelenchoides avenae]|nr:hypothetical protein AAVH_04448 [Aphelenchus avenae]